MLFVIDYGDEEPNQELIKEMSGIMDLIKERLSPIMIELNQSEGIFILHSDNKEYEVKETPHNIWYKIDQLIKPNMFPGF